MGVLKVGNGWYFFYIALAILLTVGGYFLLRKRSKKFIYYFILGLTILNFVIHFCKMLLPEYRIDYPMIWRHVTFTNICAASVLLFPFIHLSKSKVLKDYIVMISLIGGLAAWFVPTGAWNYPPFRLESLRFYAEHILLFVCAFYTLIFKIHVPSYKRFWIMPITFFGVLGLIFANEVVLRAAGFTEQTLEDMLFDRTQRNSLFLFGPRPEVEKLFTPITAIVPNFMKRGLGYRSGQEFYWPWVWLLVPIMTYGELAAHAIGFIWGWKELKDDLQKKKQAKIEELAKE